MDQISYETALLWVFLLPLAGALVNGLLGRNADRSLVGGIAVGSVAISFLLSLRCSVHVLGRVGGEGDAKIVTDVYAWMSVGSLPIDVRFVLDPLSAVMTLFVTGIATLIHVFSLGYMSEEKSWARFFAYLNLFTASMLLLVLASSLPVLFVGWEGVGVCSYLLIGFWHEEGAFADAAKKAFIVNRIGDFGLVAGMLVLAFAASSFEMSAINTSIAGSPHLHFAQTDIKLATVGGLLLFLGASGKSAQLPLYVWLPDAMAGPTPVSALIHAATMVTAGVYLCCRLSGVFLASHTVLVVIAFAGALTALIGALSALVQTDLKKILAYSTVSQLGFMFAAVGVGAFTAGLFHVVTHAFFKACLFLGAGSIMHAVHAHGDADVRFLGGLGKKLPRTHATFLISVLAIAGLPPLAGFFSKDEILAGAASVGLYAGESDPFFATTGYIVLTVLGISAVLTAFYMFRAYAMIFRGTYKGAENGYADEPHESEPVLTVPLIVLAVGACVVGFIGLPHAWHLPNLLGHVLEGTVQNLAFETATSLPSFIALGVGLTAAIVGLFAAHVAYPGDGEDKVTALPARMRSFFMRSFAIDDLYARVVARPVRVLAEFAAAIDRTLVDFVLVEVPRFAVAQASRLFVKMQDGVVHTYALAMAVGLAALVGFYTYPHMDVTATVNGNAVTLHTEPGLGYRYRWDTDGDARGDEGWESELAAGKNEIEVHYQPSDFSGIELLVRTDRYPDSTLRLGRHPRELTEADLEPGQLVSTELGELRPVVWVEGNELHVRPNGRQLYVGARALPLDQESVVRANESLRVGRSAMIIVLPVVRVGLEVETAFGQRVHRTFDIALMQESMRTDLPVTEIAGEEEGAP